MAYGVECYDAASRTSPAVVGPGVITLETTSMNTRALTLLCSLTLAASCSGAAAPPTSAGETAGGSPAAVTQTEAPAAAAAFVEGRDYTILERARFMDEAGFERPAEAFSVLLPRGWRHEGGIVWKGLQECRSETVSARWGVSSPDGAIRFQSLPIHGWGWTSDPMMLQHMQAMQQQGGCEVGGPIDATQYMREVFAARELQGATIVEVRANEAATRELQDQASRNMATLRQYSGGGQVNVQSDAVVARLRWDDGTEGIALVSVFNVITDMPNQFTGQVQRVTNSNASERSYIRFPAERRAEAEALLANLKSSYRTNPQWKEAIEGYFVRMRQQQDAIHHQRMAAIAEQTAANARAHASRMADIQRQGEANTARFNQRMADMDTSMRSWETQQSSQDRMHTAFVQTIREVETWQGGDGTVELSSGYGQAWSRGDGSYILSNSPSFDPRTVLQDQQWQELKRADR